MPFTTATLIVDARCVESLSDAFMEQGAYSVDVTDAAAGTNKEQPLFAEPGSAPIVNWPVNRVVALFAEDADVAALVPQEIGRAHV